MSESPAQPAGTLTKRRVLDVGALPNLAFGARDPLWWGVMLVIGIEATMLVLLVVSYFYVESRTTPFPPADVGRDIATLATLELALWIASTIPQRMSSRNAIAGRLRPLRRSLIAATLLATAALAVKCYLIAQLPFRWDAHAFGSVVWALIGLHFLHGVTAILEDAVYCVLLFVGPVEDKHRVDIEVSSPLVYFVAIGWLFIWAVVFVPAFVGGG